MKLNELICPTCGLKCLTEASYTTCDSCQTMFYASQSKSVNRQPQVEVTWPFTQPTIIQVQPQVNPPWTGEPYPNGPTCMTTGQLICDQTDYQVWN